MPTILTTQQIEGYYTSDPFKPNSKWILFRRYNNSYCVDCFGLLHHFQWYLVDPTRIGIEDRATYYQNKRNEQTRTKPIKHSYTNDIIQTIYYGEYPISLEERFPLKQPDFKTRTYRKLTIGEDEYYEHIGFRHAAYLQLIAGKTFQRNLPPYQWIYENMEE